MNNIIIIYSYIYLYIFIVIYILHYYSITIVCQKLLILFVHYSVILNYFILFKLFNILKHFELVS